MHEEMRFFQDDDSQFSFSLNQGSRPVDLNPPKEQEIFKWKQQFLQYINDFFYSLWNDGFHHVDDILSQVHQVHDVGALADKLISSEFVVCRQAAAQAEALSHHLGDLYGRDSLAVVIVGGATQGGTRVRRIFQPILSSDEDFDFGVVAKRGLLSKHDLSQIVETSRIFFQSIWGEHAPEICNTVNPRNVNLPILTSAEEARQILLGENPINGVTLWDFRSDSWMRRYSLGAYLVPSYPGGINDQNRFFLQLALQDLSKSDFNSWQMVVKGILSMWFEIHSLKQKHLLCHVLEDKKKYQLATKGAIVAQYSGKIMSETMRDWLNQTNLNSEKKLFRWWV